ILVTLLTLLCNWPQRTNFWPVCRFKDRPMPPTILSAVSEAKIIIPYTRRYKHEEQPQEMAVWSRPTAVCRGRLCGGVVYRLYRSRLPAQQRQGDRCG